MTDAEGAQWVIALLTAMESDSTADFNRLLNETTMRGVIALASCALIGVRTAAKVHGVSTERMLQDGGIAFASWSEEETP